MVAGGEILQRDAIDLAGGIEGQRLEKDDAGNATSSRLNLKDLKRADGVGHALRRPPCCRR